MSTINADLLTSQTTIIANIGNLYETLIDLAQSYLPLSDNIAYDDDKLKAVGEIVDLLVSNFLKQCIQERVGYIGMHDYKAEMNTILALAERKLFSNVKGDVAQVVIAVMDNVVTTHMAPYVPDPQLQPQTMIVGFDFNLANCVVITIKNSMFANELHTQQTIGKFTARNDLSGQVNRF